MAATPTMAPGAAFGAAFKVLDAALVFMTRTKMPPRVQPLLRLAESLSRGKAGPITLDVVRVLCALVPQALELSYVPEGSVDSLQAALGKAKGGVEPPFGFAVDDITYHLELCWKKGFGGVSKSGVDKRARLLENALKNAGDVVQMCPLPPHPCAPGLAGEPDELLEAPGDSTQPSAAAVGNLRSRYCSGEGMGQLDLDGILRFLKDTPFFQDQLVHVESYERRGLRTGTLEATLHPSLSGALRDALGVKVFFRHQARAIDAALAGRDVIVCTATSSGKSLIFGAPVFQAVLEASGVKDRGAPTESGGFVLDEPDLDDDDQEERPALERASSTRQVTSLFVFPTKALAQDQLGSSRRLADEVRRRCGHRVRINTFDGDTPRQDRDRILAESDIIITNPDMLHVTILPGHKRWAPFLERLRFVVIDEAHMYHGVFGSHVASVIKRLLRISALYTPRQPQFFCLSATIGNPLELYRKLVPGSTNQAVVVGDDEDGSPCGRRVLGIWNPPLKDRGPRSKKEPPLDAASVPPPPPLPPVDAGDDVLKTEQPPAQQPKQQISKRRGGSKKSEPENEAPSRKSPIYETALLLSALVRLGVKTLAFCRTRKLTELVLRYTKDELKNGYKGKVYGEGKTSRPLKAEFARARPHLADQVAAYRGGFQIKERRQVEERLFSGELLAVTATCALELGIDVGHLDAVLILGYPGSASSMWQQIGRAGRSGKDALALFVCFDGAVDQFFCKRPEMLVDKSRVEDAVLDPLNKHVLKDHLLCALAEKPLVLRGDPEDDDEDVLRLAGALGVQDPAQVAAQRQKVLDALAQLEADELVVRTRCNGATIFETHAKLARPYNNVSLRTIDPVTLELYHGDLLMDTIPYGRAFFELYPGAIYMHQGRSFLVTRLDLTAHRAYAHPTNVAYYTAPRDTTTVNIVSKFESKRHGPDFEVHCGAVEVVTRVWGYRKMWLRSGRVFEMHEFTLPPIQYETQAIWIDLSTEIQEAVTSAGLCLRSGIHAVNHMILKLVPLFVICFGKDINTEHVGIHFKRPMPPRLMFFDQTPGGIGASESAFAHVFVLLWRAYHLLQSCDCDNGCPACCVDMHCSGYNAMIDKEAACVIMRALLSGTTDPATKAAVSPRSAPVDTTPQRKRKRAVGRAMGMGRARVEQIKIAKAWTDLIPNHSEGMR